MSPACSVEQSKGIKAEEIHPFVLNSMDEGFCLVELLVDEKDRTNDFRFLQTNSAFEQQTGLVNAAGKRVRELVPNLEQHWYNVYGEVALTGKAIRFESFSAAMNRWFTVYALRVGGPESRNIALIFNDITKRKQAEGRTELLVRLSRKLATVTSDQEIIAIATAAVGVHLNVDRCYFVECRESENLIVASANWLRSDSPTLEGQHSLHDFGGMEWWRQYSAGNFSVADTDTHPLTRDQRNNYAAIHVRSYAAQPFRRGNASTVVLGVTEKTPREWTPDELNLMDDVVARAWSLVERARNEQALRASQKALEQHAHMLEALVAERTEKLQEAIRELETFSYSISHDLRAPLRAMQGFANILAEDCGDRVGDLGMDYIRRIVSASERMDRLIQDLLVYSRVARNDMPLERIELTSFLTEILKLYPQLDRSGALIEVIGPLPAVKANPAALTQCLSNLLGNAVRFVAAGVRPHVKIWAEPTDVDTVRLCVGDNGVGIDDAVRDRIFNIFYQVDKSRGGSGIGLSVVRKAVERMGGRVSVQSEPGRGSIFQLELRAADAT